MKSLALHRSLGITAVLILFFVSPLMRAQTYTDIHDFVETDGCCANYPSMMAQGQDGNIYGTTTSGGTLGAGNIFRLTPSGTFTVIYNFTGSNGDGEGPQGGLALGFDGNFYGTTYQGGTGHAGTIFKVTPSGAETVLYAFTNGNDGGFARTPPVQARDGNLYGISGTGTTPALYKLTPAGAFSIIAASPSQSFSTLVAATDGNLYGMTQYGGTFNRGTVFQVALSGKKPKLKIIHSFDCTKEGCGPNGGLMQGSDGNLYGTATGGGSGSGGTVFQVTTKGKVTTLYNFDAQNPVNGSLPYGGLVQGSDGLLYGAASTGGSTGLGTFFRLTTKGTNFTVLHNFDTPSGDTPLSTPLLHTNGTIYGMTSHGGSHAAYGTIYTINAGLSAFVEQFVNYSGKVGDSVALLGQGFSNATGVNFGTGAGSFVASTDNYLTATVQTNDTTGKITVLEPGGNLSTPQNYNVIPTISGFKPPSGPVGTQVVISGTSFKQTTTVTFGGVKATAFSIDSDSQVTATVPTGAKTGKIGITTKGGKATSKSSFTVQ